MADPPENHTAVEEDLGRLAHGQRGTSWNSANVNILNLGKNNPKHQYRLGDDLENSPVEKDLVVLVNTKLSISQQGVLVVKKSNGILRCVRKSSASR